MSQVQNDLCCPEVGWKAQHRIVTGNVIFPQKNWTEGWLSSFQHYHCGRGEGLCLLSYFPWEQDIIAVVIFNQLLTRILSIIWCWWHVYICPVLKRQWHVQHFLQICMLHESFGFVVGRANFLPSSWYGNTFCICAGNVIDNLKMFPFLLSSEDSLHRVKTFSLTPPRQAKRLGWQKTEGDDIEGRADPCRSEGHSIPYGIMLSIL